jgi:tetratricopeptide (TPR) repeat protein
MIQAEKGQFKDALKTLTKAHELAPYQSDILLERAIVNRHLGKLDDAAHDQKRGMQLGSSSLATVAMLEDRIKKLREEIDLKGESTKSHFELGMAFDGLLTQKKGSTAKLEYYKEAVIEYKAAIEIDQDNFYPQARALLALCQNKMNDLVESNQMHLEFYNILREHKGAIHHWTAFLEEVKEKKGSDKLDPHLDEAAVRKLIKMELNQRKMNVDVEEFENDKEDIYKNQLAFYKRLRIDLSNLLSAIALLSLDSDIIAHNLKGTPSKYIMNYIYQNFRN